MRLWVQVRCTAPSSLSVRASVPVASTAQVTLPVEVLGVDSAGSNSNKDVVVTEGGAVVFDSSGMSAGAAELSAGLNSAELTVDHAGRQVVVVSTGSGAFDFNVMTK